MRILVLTKKFPYPLKEGEPIAITNLCRSLKAWGAQLTLLAMNTSKHYFDLSKLPAGYDHFEKIHAVDVDNRISAGGALLSLLKGQPYILSRFQNEDFRQALEKLLTEEKFDIVQIETPYLAAYVPLIRRLSSAPIVMRAHNVEHEIWERVARSSSLPKKLYLRNQNKHLRRVEVGMLNEYDLLLAITADDLNRFRELGLKKAGLVAPAGLVVSEYQPKPFDKATSIGFIGALDWMPNQQGVIWFLEKVWPELRKNHPGLIFEIAGKNTPDWLMKKGGDGVKVLGEVPDAKEFINRHALFVAPLFSGSGIKIKILEGMALQRAVLTTPIGLEGIPAQNGVHVLSAESAREFVLNVELCLNQPDVATSLGQAARQLMEREFDLYAIGRRVFAEYERLCGT
ncbi:MAG: glycosyl transferase family 1 [Saprospirales bacterium]|nr:glycosyl transferase family 1 [Saprospirales bacterium]